MTTSYSGGMYAPSTDKAIIVSASGLAVTFDVKTSEKYKQSRTVTSAAVEVGYKISDGQVTDQPDISFDGIVTGIFASGSRQKVWDPVSAASAIANMQAVFDAGEFCSVYTSFNAKTNCQIVDFEADTEPKKNQINVKMSAKAVKVVNFAYTKNAPPSKNKSKSPAAAAQTTSGKKTAEKKDSTQQEKESILNAILF